MTIQDSYDPQSQYRDGQKTSSSNSIMSSIFDNVRRYLHSHPMSAAAGIIALSVTYLYITGRSLCVTGLCNNTTSTRYVIDSGTIGVSIYDAIATSLAERLRLPISMWSDKLNSTPLAQAFRDTYKNVLLVLIDVGERLAVDVHQLLEALEDHWALDVSLPQLTSIAFTTALPGAFLIFIRSHPNSWTARHKIRIANVLHIFALLVVANGRISVQDLWVAAFVMVSFEALQRISHESGAGPPPAVETILSQTHTVIARSDLSGSPRPAILSRKHSSSDLSTTLSTKDAESDRLHRRIGDFKTAEKAREVDLRRTKAELHNARATLNESFAEYASLHDELQRMKQALGRDHQAAIYRKDIELFALRKANEQKENHIRDREAELEDLNRQHEVALALRDAELQNLKERIVFLERQTNPRSGRGSKVDSATENDSQAALQVKFLRVKGRNSTEVDERTLDEKDNEITKLKSELADAANVREILNNTQIELRRAWHAMSKAQQALHEERKSHLETQEKLREAASKIEDEYEKGAQPPSPGRLSTIEEQDKQELEAMFNTAQQDNLRLYGEVEALEKRVREANARVFLSEQAAQALREQLRLEKAINEDIETAQASLVHRVHFQRMEGQLKEIREQLDAKDKQVKNLQKSATEREAKVEQLIKDKEASASARSKLQEENESLKKKIEGLESTNQQLVFDHQRLARHRARTRTTSVEHSPARSSGATLITEPAQPIPPMSTEEEPPLPPARPVSIARSIPTSIQVTPERHLRREPPPRLSMITNDVPPAELRHKRPKALTLKSLMRKITKKDEDGEEREKRPVVESPRPKTASLPKDWSRFTRPKTAAPGEEQRPKTSAAKEAEHRRYYSESIPKTSAATAEDGQRPKSRGWAASRRLVRKSTVG